MRLFLSRDLIKARKLHGRMSFQGLPISVENRAGSRRYWYDPAADEHGSTKMKYPYGYVRGTLGLDGDAVDVFVGPDESSDRVFVITQMKRPSFKEVDEQKVMLGFNSAKEAKQAYLKHFNDPRFFGSMKELSVSEFKTALEQNKGKLIKHLYLSSPSARLEKSTNMQDDDDISKKFRSVAQQKYMYAAAERGEIPKEVVQEFSEKTKDFSKLPQRVKKAEEEEYDDSVDKGNYTKPELRERIKRRVMAGSDGGKPGQWSARKAQLVAQKYKAAGGGYKGKKSKAQSSLKKWTSEKWTTSDGKPAEKPDGTMRRYLPKKAWDKLSAEQKAATNKKKIEGSKEGKQFVANTKAAQKARKKETSKSVNQKDDNMKTVEKSCEHNKSVTCEQCNGTHSTTDILKGLTSRMLSMTKRAVERNTAPVKIDSEFSTQEITLFGPQVAQAMHVDRPFEPPPVPVVSVASPMQAASPLAPDFMSSCGGCGYVHKSISACPRCEAIKATNREATPIWRR